MQQRWSLEEGLPQASVEALARDGRGFLWVGTQRGLARFDGREFVTVRPSVAAGMASDFIAALAVDDGDRVWAGTKDGLLVVDGRRLEAVASGTFGAVNELRWHQGRLLIAAERGLFSLAPGEAPRELRPGLAGPILAVRPAGAGVWVAAPGRVLSLDASGGERESLAVPAEERGVKEILDECGGPWFGGLRGLYRRGLEGGLSRIEAIGALNVNSLLCGADGLLWVATGSGLVRLAGERVVERVDDEVRLAHLWLTPLLADRDDALFLGSNGGGLLRLRSPRYTLVGRADGLPAGPIWGVASGAADLWFGTARNLFRYREGAISPLDRRREIPGEPVMSLYEDRRGRLWASSRSSLWRIDGGEPERAGIVLRDSVAAIYESAAGDLWFGGFGGLYRERQGAVEGPLAEIPLPRIRVVLESPAFGLVLGSERGLFAWREGRLRRLDAPESAPNLVVLAATEIAPGEIWVGSNGAGLWIVREGAVRRLTERDGLIHDAVNWIGRDAAADVWISTQGGVQRIAAAVAARLADPATPFAAESVLSIAGSAPGSDRALCCSGGGRAAATFDAAGDLWLTSVGGAIRLPTAGRTPPRRAARPLLTRLEVEGEERPLALAVELGAWERDLTLAFTAPEFDRPQQLRFRYRLEGYDQAERETAERFVQYTNLPAGRYRFRVAAFFAGQGEASEAASLDLMLAPKPREMLAVQLAALGMLGLLGFGAVRWRTRRLAEQRERLARLVEARTGELAVANRRLREQSVTDPLTGLHNRRYLAEAGEAHPALAAVRRLLLLLDVDRFKAINDRFGHATGDAALIEIAARLRLATGENDLVLRWGGEEFLLVRALALGERAEEEVAAVLAAVRGARVESPAGPVALAASGGFVVLPLSSAVAPRDFEQALRLADRGLYEAKAGGRNRACGYAATAPLARPLAAIVEAADELVAAGALAKIEITS